MDRRVKIDSRLVEPGDIFVAIRGGINYVEDALSRGAKLCVVSEGKFEGRENILVVPDTIAYLSELAAEKRNKFSGRVIGITGSAGKTTCKEMIVYAFRSRGKRISFCKGNYNNIIGLSLSILEADLENDFWVLELGTNSVGEIAKLTAISKPDISVITSIYPSHLEGLIDLKTIALEKSAISNFSEITIVPIQYYWYISEFLNGKKVFWSSEIIGRFPISGKQFENLMGIVKTLGDVLGLDLVNVDWSLFRMPKGRFNIIHVGDRLVVDDTYNANPGSVKASLDTLLHMNVMSPVALVLGDMLELGHNSIEYHKDIVAFSDFLFPKAKKIFIGRNFYRAVCEEDKLNKASFLCLDTWLNNETVILNFLKNCSTIFVKGSNSIKLYKLVDYFLECWQR